jgi:GNAT superfamily N-acetyltransferase
MKTYREDDEPKREAIISLFEGIAAAEGWQPGDQLRAHTARSIYFGVWTSRSGRRGENKLVGGLQLVTPNEVGRLPTHQAWPELARIDPASPVLHAAVLAVLPEWRGRDSGAAFWSLGIALWRHCTQQGVKTIWLEATPKMLRCYKLLGWPLEPIGELREHWGEPVYPCRLAMRDVAGSLAERALTSTTYRRIFTRALQPSQALGESLCLSSHTKTATPA